jgi:hypothetical protein
MTTTQSGYERQAHDLYETPTWVIDALAEVIPLRGRIVWEPACGPGKMVGALRARGATVIASDYVDHGLDGATRFDFTSDEPQPVTRIHAIITNPPYGKGNRMAEIFARKAIDRIPNGGFVALLLPTKFDHGKTRSDLFGDCPHFAGKIVLTERIQWFEGDHSSTESHAWFIWRRDALGQPVRPTMWFAPRLSRKGTP